MDTQKVAIITGTGAPIDEALKKAFTGEHVAVELVGYKVDSEPSIAARPGRRIIDFTNEEEVRGAIASIVKKWQRIDYLVTCPDLRLISRLTDLEEKDWEKTIALNLTSVFLMCKYVLPLMVRQRAGKIINLSSDAAHLGAIKGAAYAAAKAGVIGFSKGLSREVSGQGITVNVVSVGLVGEGAVFFAEGLERNSIPLGRVGRWEEVADVIICLLSEKMSYMTGQTIHVNGGLFMP